MIGVQYITIRELVFFVFRGTFKMQ